SYTRSSWPLVCIVRRTVCAPSATSAFSPIKSGTSRGATSRRLFATRAPHKFSFTVRADEIHLPGATRAKSAFVTANVCDATQCERGSAFFTCAFQLQPHFHFHSLRAPQIVQRRNRSMDRSVFSVC